MKQILPNEAELAKIKQPVRAFNQNNNKKSFGFGYILMVLVL